MDGASDSWSRDWLVPFLLLCVRDRDLYGHELLEQLAAFGFGTTRPGEVYRVSRSLEGEGLIFSERGNMDYLISRRRYGITEDGKAYLDFLAHSFEEYRREVEHFFLAYGERPAHQVYG